MLEGVNETEDFKGFVFFGKRFLALVNFIC